jgi:inorganic pyrophosphatase
MEKLVLNVTIEIPKHSNVKYEYDRKSGKIFVDRILFGPSVYPQNYGFTPDALDWDGDELDVLVFADQQFQPGIIVPTKIIGAMEMIDNKETDTKLIGVIDCDPR